MTMNTILIHGANGCIGALMARATVKRRVRPLLAGRGAAQALASNTPAGCQTPATASGPDRIPDRPGGARVDVL